MSFDEFTAERASLSLLLNSGFMIEKNGIAVFKQDGKFFLCTQFEDLKQVDIEESIDALQLAD